MATESTKSAARRIVEVSLAIVGGITILFGGAAKMADALGRVRRPRRRHAHAACFRRPV